MDRSLERNAWRMIESSRMELAREEQKTVDMIRGYNELAQLLQFLWFSGEFGEEAPKIIGKKYTIELDEEQGFFIVSATE